MSEPILIGIDGGGTRTRAMVACEQGRSVGIGAAGPGNFHDIGEPAVTHNVRAAVSAAWSALDRRPRPADSVFLGLGSIVTPADRVVAERIARALDLSATAVVGVDHDLRIALAGALGSRPGVVLIAGTGASCIASDASGRTVVVGGWGRTLDDLGSGYDLGLRAMRAVVRAEDGRAPATALRATVRSAFGVSELRELMRIMDGPGSDARRLVADLAPDVLRLARSGDAAAVEIVADGAEALAELVGTALLKQPGSVSTDGRVRVVVVGGLTGSDAYMEALFAAIHRRFRAAVRTEGEGSPLEGALYLAARQLNPPPPKHQVPDPSRPKPS